MQNKRSRPALKSHPRTKRPGHLREQPLPTEGRNRAEDAIPAAEGEPSQSTGDAGAKASATGATPSEQPPAATDQKRSEPKAPATQDARKLGSSYIHGFDGLRAIAVGAVLLYHIAPNQFVGGYVGVDFFFVISGFLITYRILQGVRKQGDKYSLGQFWLRRLRRLMPALVLLVIVCVPLGAIIYPDLLVGGVRQVVGALTYLTNWIEIFHGSNYFDQANPMLFKNLWSVAVEEQFYLIWPPILLALLAVKPLIKALRALGRSGKVQAAEAEQDATERRRRGLTHRQLLAVAGGIALVSALLMGILASPDNYTRVYYGTDTHCFGLALGILLAVVWDQEKGPFSREWLASQAWVRYLAPVGLAGFVLLVLFVPDTARFTYPLGLLLASLCSLALVTSVVARPSALFVRVMELAPMRWLGTRSYGIYLWHWPLLVFGRILVPTAVGTVENVVVDVLFVLISLVVSELSYRYVEEPFRRDGILRSLEGLARRARTGRAGKAQALACAVLVVATVVSLATAPEKTQLQQAVEGFESQTGQEQQAEATTPADSEADTSTIPNYDPSQTTGVPDGSTVTAIGDSLISGTADGFRDKFDGLNFLAAPIRQWGDAVDVVNEGLEQGVIRQNVILDFGTNGGVSDEQLVRQVIEALGPERRIVLYTIYSPSTFVDDANAVYAKIAEEYPNVRLADWASVARAHPEYLHADRTHPDMDGMYPFVDAAIEAFSQS